MLGEAKSSLHKGGFSSQASAWTLIGCFLGGALVIQVVSQVAHHFMSHQTVDCDHDHHDEETGKPSEDGHAPNGHGHKDGDHVHEHTSDYSRPSMTELSTEAKKPTNARSSEYLQSDGSVQNHRDVNTLVRRPSLPTRWTNKVSKIVSGRKSLCDEHGQCYGYSEPCGQECFEVVQARVEGQAQSVTVKAPRHPSLLRSSSTPTGGAGARLSETQPLLSQVDEEAPLVTGHQPSYGADLCCGSGSAEDNSATEVEDSALDNPKASTSKAHDHAHQSDADHEHNPNASHHHHVPTNAFLSVGLQTSLAIALHKLPEGFITYATNHANPRLGFAVFLALFIHNITEGFAMALPLYLAINSRWKAMFWSSLLGGVSQPLGAGVAALWFKIAGNNDSAPGEGVYGVMFCVIAGIMASVALQLFNQSVELTHNRNICMLFAFVGMAILGVSSALTA